MSTRIIAAALVLAAACTVTPAASPSPPATAPTAPPDALTASTPPIPRPSAPLPGRYGLIVGTEPPRIRSETDPAYLGVLTGEDWRGAVSPDGRQVAWWEAYRSGVARILWVSDASGRAARKLITLPDSEVAAISTFGGVAWSTDGTGLLIAVNSRDHVPSTTPDPAYLYRASPSAERVLMRTFFDEARTVHVWRVADARYTALDTAPGERVVAALWRTDIEVVVSLSTSGEREVGDRLEVWSVDGQRRVILTARHRLDAVRPDGSAAITSAGIVDLVTGAVAQAPDLGSGLRVLASVLLR